MYNVYKVGDQAYTVFSLEGQFSSILYKLGTAYEALISREVSFFQYMYTDSANDVLIFDTYMYSTVPQNVLVVASPNSDSLLKPKSVRTTCPWSSSIMFSGFKSL